MTRDSGSERPQRTVAELLAEYGGTAGDAPRRRRRRAEDDGDSAPQTIIERVLSDSGKLLPIRDDQPPEPPRRAGGHRSGEPRRPIQQPAQQPPQPPAKPPVAGPPVGSPPAGLPQAGSPQGQPTAYAEPVRPGNPPTGRQPLPPGGLPPSGMSQPMSPPMQPPARQPGASPAQQSGQFSTSRPGMPPVGPQQGRTGPQPGQSSRPGMSPVPRKPAMPRPVGPQPRPPVPPVDDAATAIHPPLPDDFDFPQAQPPTVLQAPVPAPPRPGNLPPGNLPPDAGVTEEFPPVPGDVSGPLRPAAPGRPGPGNSGVPTQLVPPVGPPGRRPGPQSTSAALESTQAHAGPYVDESDPGFPPVGVPDHVNPEAFPSRDDDYDDESPAVAKVDFDDVEEPVSAGREWLMMGAQVGAGAIAGAVVWLAFSWLWGLQPVLAVIAALAVIVGLVMGVRRWRRADDLQTTVLAVLAGLVVTVSPAALLLLHR